MVGFKAGKFSNVPFEQTPCSQCELKDTSHHVIPYDDGRRPPEPVIEDGTSADQTTEEELMMPVSVLSGVVALLMFMPSETRDIVCWRHQGMPYREIAEALGATVAAVELRHRRALVKWPLLRTLFLVKTAKQAKRMG
jgi:DNA-directed RNA polymerase specialized sigma24 family protein